MYTARDKGLGTGDKGNANTARDEGKGIREQPIQMKNEATLEIQLRITNYL